MKIKNVKMKLYNVKNEKKNKGNCRRFCYVRIQNLAF